MSSPQEQAAQFKARLEAMEPMQRGQMMTLLQAISKSPESMVDLFERLGLRWERRYLDSEVYSEGAMVIDWKQFMAAEKELQNQGPVLKRLIASEFGENNANQIQVKPTGEVVPRFDPVPPPGQEPKHAAPEEFRPRPVKDQPQA